MKKGRNGDKIGNLFAKNANTDIRLTEKQKELAITIKNNVITFISGCWGTSKTFTACKVAYDMLASGNYDRILITKPIVEAGENIGFLKGDLEDKVGPYSESYWDTFAKISNDIFMRELKDTGQVKFTPVAYMRGNNFDRCVVIVDEAQNLSEKQMMLVVSRLGKESKMLIVGDSNQTDIPDKASGFATFSKIMEGIEGIGYFRFGVEDIMREPILIEISKRYEIWKSEQENSRVKGRIDG